MYYGTAIQYMDRCIWRLETYFPEKDSRIWDMFQGHPQEYFTSIRIRGAAIRVVKELERDFLIGKASHQTTPYWNTSNERNCSTTKKETSKESP